jgi:hypothetical protein
VINPRTLQRNLTLDQNVGAVGVNWRVHTSSGLIERPESVRKGFLTCTYDDLEHDGYSAVNAKFRSFVKMKHIIGPSNPHRFSTTPGTITVGEDGNEITAVASRKPITRMRIGIHWYATRSKMEYEEKHQRISAKRGSGDDPFWEEIEHETPQVQCPEMAEYEP